MPCVLLPIRAVRWSGGAVDQILEVAFLQVLVEAPALDLLEHAFELLAGDRLVDETLASGEAAVVPFLLLEFGWDAVPPQRQVLGEIRLERALGAVERAQIAAHAFDR